jgi:hypothetical protein
MKGYQLSHAERFLIGLTLGGSELCVSGIARVFDRLNEISGIRLALNCDSFVLTVCAGTRDTSDILERVFDGLFAMLTTHSFNRDGRGHTYITMTALFIQISISIFGYKTLYTFDSEEDL